MTQSLVYLRDAVATISQVATFSMYRGSSEYARLARAARDFEFGTRAFQVLVGIKKGDQTRDRPEQKEVKLLLRPDVRVNNVEVKISTLADQLARLTLILKTEHDQQLHDHVARKQGGTREVKNCSFCCTLTHGAN